MCTYSWYLFDIGGNTLEKICMNKDNKQSIGIPHHLQENSCSPIAKPKKSLSLLQCVY